VFIRHDRELVGDSVRLVGSLWIFSAGLDAKLNAWFSEGLFVYH
jgi:hypothetical protein